MNRHDVFIGILLIMLAVITMFTTCLTLAVHKAGG
jgi:hypothetical protein